MTPTFAPDAPKARAVAEPNPEIPLVTGACLARKVFAWFLYPDEVAEPEFDSETSGPPQFCGARIYGGPRKEPRFTRNIVPIQRFVKDRRPAAIANPSLNARPSTDRSGHFPLTGPADGPALGSAANSSEIWDASNID